MRVLILNLIRFYSVSRSLKRITIQTKLKLRWKIHVIKLNDIFSSTCICTKSLYLSAFLLNILFNVPKSMITPMNNGNQGNFRNINIHAYEGNISILSHISCHIFWHRMLMHLDFVHAFRIQCSIACGMQWESNLYQRSRSRANFKCPFFLKVQFKISLFVTLSSWKGFVKRLWLFES